MHTIPYQRHSEVPQAPHGGPFHGKVTSDVVVAQIPVTVTMTDSKIEKIPRLDEKKYGIIEPHTGRLQVPNP